MGWEEQAVIIIQSLETFVLELERLEKASTPQRVVQQVLAWTGGQSHLTEKVCQLVLQTPESIADGQEAMRIAELVRSHLTENWQTGIAADHLEKLRDRILNCRRPVALLQQYQALLSQETMPANRSWEHKKLLELELVYLQHKQLNLHNPIYTIVFDSEWIQQELDRLSAPLSPATAPFAPRPATLTLPPATDATTEPAVVPDADPHPLHLHSHNWQCTNSLKSQASTLISLAFSADGQTLASLGERQDRRGTVTQVETWNLSAGGKSGQMTLPFDDYLSIAYTAKGDLLAGRRLSPKITVFHVQQRKQICTLRGHSEGVICLTLSADGCTLASGGKDKQIKVWNLNDGDPPHLPYNPNRFRDAEDFYTVALSPDGRILAIANQPDTLLILYLGKKSRLLPLDLDCDRDRSPKKRFERGLFKRPKRWIVKSVAFHLGGRILAIGRENVVELWDLRTQKPLHFLTGHASEVTAVAFSPTGHQLASSSKGEIRIWDLSDQA